MNTSIFHPSPLLSPFIDFYKVIYSPHPIDLNHGVTGYPTGYTDLVIAPQKRFNIYSSDFTYKNLSGTQLFGHFRQQFQITLPSEFYAVWVRMKPHGLFALTGVPAKEFYNSCQNFDEIVPQSIFNIDEIFREKEAPSLTIKRLEKVLSAQISQSYHHDSQLEFILSNMIQQVGNCRLKDLCTKLGMGYRALDRLFWKKVGQSPKRLLRNLRFKFLLDNIQQQPEIDWMQLVADYDFHDQSHLIKEFQHFTQHAPQAFRQQKQGIGKGNGLYG